MSYVCTSIFNYLYNLNNILTPKSKITLELKTVNLSKVSAKRLCDNIRGFITIHFVQNETILNRKP